jgi:hypothetical protein
MKDSMVDGLRYYDLDAYLFEDVHKRFWADGSIGAFDFFSIVVWKANRAKSRIAKRLIAKYPRQDADLDAIVHKLTGSLFNAESHAERLRILLEDWGLYLPMASAVLAVLYPDYFTVYDYRVCEQLGRFQELSQWSQFDKIWPGYQQYREAVLAAGPDGLSLREKDRYFGGMSRAMQLAKDIEACFAKPGDKKSPALPAIEQAAAKADAETLNLEVAAEEQRFDLCSEDDMLGGRRYVWLRLTKEGSLVLEGQDLGGAANSYWGTREYEWAWSLRPEQLGSFLISLGIEPSDQAVLESIGSALNGLDRSELQKVFEEAGATFWSSSGD